MKVGKLVKCRDCGGNAKFRHIKSGHYRIQCNRCGQYIVTVQPSIVVGLWNARQQNRLYFSNKGDVAELGARGRFPYMLLR